jgi:MerR family transcriptional regulator, heat shock protein HspR
MVAWQQRIEDEAEPVYPIGVVARLLDVSVQVIRRYDTEDVVTPDRSDGGQRRYSRADVQRLAYALELTAEGIPSNGIRRIFDLEERLATAEEAVAADTAEAGGTGDAADADTAEAGNAEAAAAAGDIGEPGGPNEAS